LVISVCFRFDDPSANSVAVLERRIFEVFARESVPLCVAAIPFLQTRQGATLSLSPENAAHLVEAANGGTIEIALHGHSHVRRGNSSSNRLTEFAGLSAPEQFNLMREGRDHLASIFGRPILGFVPPWNTYDRTTIQVAEKLGFQFLSGGMEILEHGSLPIVPRTCNIRTGRHAIERALLFRALSPVVVIVFHPDEFEEFPYPPLPGGTQPFTCVAALAKLLRWIRSLPGVEVTAISTIAEERRKGVPLRDLRALRMPDRLRTQLPPALARSGRWTTMLLAILAAVQSKYLGKPAVDRGRAT
jgi:peptidoglycan/xylan/chitin deacetylase (PgdA/CDA1 family)